MSVSGHVSLCPFFPSFGEALKMFSYVVIHLLAIDFPKTNGVGGGNDLLIED
jgi:hypothetical protein